MFMFILKINCSTRRDEHFVFLPTNISIASPLLLPVIKYICVESLNNLKGSWKKAGFNDARRFDEAGKTVYCKKESRRR